MSINSVQSTMANQTTSTYFQQDILGKEDFLQLLVVQLENQDPLEPIRNEDFIAQLAQFSSLEQLQNLGTSMESLLALEESSINALSLSLIGKQARAQTSVVDTSLMTEPVHLEFHTSAETNVHIKIYNSSDQLVYSETRLAKAGTNSFEWDGTDSEGNALPEGQYRFEVTSPFDSQGDSETYPTFIVGPVLGVDFSTGIALVNVNGAIVDLTNVVDVRLLPATDDSGEPQDEANNVDISLPGK